MGIHDNRDESKKLFTVRDKSRIHPVSDKVFEESKEQGPEMEVIDLEQEAHISRKKQNRFKIAPILSEQESEEGQNTARSDNTVVNDRFVEEQGLDNSMVTPRIHTSKINKPKEGFSSPRSITSVGQDEEEELKRKEEVTQGAETTQLHNKYQEGKKATEFAKGGVEDDTAHDDSEFPTLYLKEGAKPPSEKTNGDPLDFIKFDDSTSEILPGVSSESSQEEEKESKRNAEVIQATKTIQKYYKNYQERNKKDGVKPPIVKTEDDTIIDSTRFDDSELLADVSQNDKYLIDEDFTFEPVKDVFSSALSSTSRSMPDKEDISPDLNSTPDLNFDKANKKPKRNIPILPPIPREKRGRLPEEDVNDSALKKPKSVKDSSQDIELESSRSVTEIDEVSFNTPRGLKPGEKKEPLLRQEATTRKVGSSAIRKSDGSAFSSPRGYSKKATPDVSESVEAVLQDEEHKEDFKDVISKLKENQQKATADYLSKGGDVENYKNSREEYAKNIKEGDLIAEDLSNTDLNKTWFNNTKLVRALNKLEAAGGFEKFKEEIDAGNIETLREKGFTTGDIKVLDGVDDINRTLKKGESVQNNQERSNLEQIYNSYKDNKITNIKESDVVDISYNESKKSAEFSTENKEKWVEKVSAKESSEKSTPPTGSTRN